MNISVTLCIASKEEIVVFTKMVEFTFLPRKEELVRFSTGSKEEDYLEYEVTDVIHNENGNPELYIGIEEDENGYYYLVVPASHLEMVVQQLINCGWTLRSRAINDAYINKV